MIRFACPSCAAGFSVADSYAGKSGRCPRCQARFDIPYPDEFAELVEVELVAEEPPAPREYDWNPPRRQYPDDDDEYEDDDRPRRRPRSERVPAGILAIFLGFLGVHKFYLGYTNAGLLMLLMTVCTCCFGSVGLAVVEGIIYLTKTDREFVERYQRNDRPWF